jgi:hypothetical protein
VDSPQVPDPTPGNYYVSLVRSPTQFSLLAGPFTAHADALAAVDEAWRMAEEVDAWAHFDSVGTVRMPDAYTKPGVLNARLGLPT